MSLRFAIQEFQKQVSLEAEYDRFNRAYFGGELPPVKLSWERSKTRGGVALGIINRATKEIRPTEIRISMFMKMDKARFDAIMLHEMIHIWQFANGLNDGHGASFKTTREKISTRAGIDIPMTDEAEKLEVSEDIKTKNFVVVLAKASGTEKLMIFGQNVSSQYDRLQEILRSMAMYSLGDFWGGVYESNDRELLKFPTMRKLPTTGSYSFYRPMPGLFDRIKSEGKLISQVTSKTIQDMLDDMKRMIEQVGQAAMKSLEREYPGSEFKMTMDSTRYKVWATVSAVNGTGKLIAEARLGEVGLGKITVTLWDGERDLGELVMIRKYPTPAEVEEYVRGEVKPGMAGKLFGVALEKVASELMRVAREMVGMEVPVEIGDMILLGRFKNKKSIVKGFGVGKLNQPTVITDKGTVPLFRFRIPKLIKASYEFRRGDYGLWIAPTGRVHVVDEYEQHKAYLPGVFRVEGIDDDPNYKNAFKHRFVRVVNFPMYINYEHPLTAGQRDALTDLVEQYPGGEITIEGPGRTSVFDKKTDPETISMFLRSASKIARELTATYGHTLWIKPDGKIIDMGSESNHYNWIAKNFAKLFPDIPFSKAAVFDAPYEAGWIHLRNHRQSFSDDISMLGTRETIERNRDVIGDIISETWTLAQRDNKQVFVIVSYSEQHRIIYTLPDDYDKVKHLFPI